MTKYKKCDIIIIILFYIFLKEMVCRLLLMLDTQEFKTKPTVKDIKIISNRIINYSVDLTPEQLAQEIIKGKSFVPGYLNTPLPNGQLKRSKNCWTSQQIICLDFDNNKRKIKEGIYKYFSLEDAKKEFKNTAMFIYTTFSHTEIYNKFRVVFATDRIIINYNEFDKIITYLLDEYIQADSQCSDGSRIFFGGKDLHVLDYNNKLKVDEILKTFDNTSKITTGGFCDYNNIELKKYSLVVTKTNIICNTTNNIDLLKTKDIKTLQEILKPKDIEFFTRSEIDNYLAQQDLHKLLGINIEPFNCIFHEDKNPSASIFIKPENNHYLYKCHSDNCSFGVGSIRKIIERILKCNNVESFRFLCELYKIKFSQTEWQIKQKEILDENIRFLLSERLVEEFPYTYKRIKNHIEELIILHLIAENNLPPEQYDNIKYENLFFSSMRHITRVFSDDKGYESLFTDKNFKRVTDRIGLWTYLGLIFKLKEDEIPDKLLLNAKENMLKLKKRIIKNMSLKGKNVDINTLNTKLISFFSIPSYSDNNMNFTEYKSKEFEEKHLSMRGWSREMILRNLGEQEADRVFPQFKGNKISKYNNKVTNMIEEQTLKLINEKGWTTEKEILDNLKLKIKNEKSYKERQIRKMFGDMAVKYNLKRIRLNKKLKEKYMIEVIGYPYIIIKGE